MKGFVASAVTSFARKKGRKVCPCSLMNESKGNTRAQSENEDTTKPYFVMPRANRVIVQPE